MILMSLKDFFFLSKSTPLFRHTTRGHLVDKPNTKRDAKTWHNGNLPNQLKLYALLYFLNHGRFLMSVQVEMYKPIYVGGVVWCKGCEGRQRTQFFFLLLLFSPPVKRWRHAASQTCYQPHTVLISDRYIPKYSTISWANVFGTELEVCWDFFTRLLFHFHLRLNSPPGFPTIHSSKSLPASSAALQFSLWPAATLLRLFHGLHSQNVTHLRFLFTFEAPVKALEWC